MASLKILSKIPEVPQKTLVPLLKPFYDILEGRKVSKSEPDRFAEQCWMSYHGLSKEDWERQHKIIQINKAWTMSWGNFHQSLMGSFPGWEDLKTGHETKCDIWKQDKTCVAEVKNNKNTMNSGGNESVMKKLKAQVALGRRTVLVVVNGDIPHVVVDGVEKMNGKDFYAELSGRETFFEDLLSTLKEIFATFKTYEQLKKSLDTA